MRAEADPRNLGRYGRHVRTIEPNLGDKARNELSSILGTQNSDERSRNIGLFALRRDNTGALKGRLLGSDLAKALLRREDTSGETGLIINADNRIETTAADKRHILGMVSLVELGKINREGGHEAGNDAMAQTVRIIESTLKTQLNLNRSPNIPREDIDNYYEIYHVGGADFAYTLHLPAAFADKVEEIKTALTFGLENQNDDENKLLLASTMISHDEAIHMFNELQERLEQNSLLVREKEVLTHFISILKKSAAVDLERKVLTQTVNRYIEKRSTGDVSAANYFENYVQRRFSGTEMASSSAFELPDSESNDFISVVTAVKTRATEASYTAVQRKLAEDRERVPQAEQIMFDIIAGEDLPPSPILSKADKSIIEEQGHKVAARGLENYRVSTEGGRKLQAYQDMLVAARDLLAHITTTTKGWPITISDDERQTLNKLLNFRSFFPDFVKSDLPFVSSDETNTETLLNLQGPVGEVSLIEKHSVPRLTMGIIGRYNIPQGYNLFGRNLFNKIVDIFETAEKEYELLSYRFDETTGLPDRVEYLLDLENRLAKKDTLPEGKSVQTLFIDLGFLQYINLGGRDVGNYALKSTAEVLEQALAEAGIGDGIAYRYAGDEFTLLFTGDADDMKRLILTIDRLKTKRGKMPRTEYSSPIYRPEELAINYGTADSILTEKVLSELHERGVQNRDDVAYQANLQTRIADRGIDMQKAESRFIFLLDRIGTLFPRHGVPDEAIAITDDSPIDKKQVDLLVKASQKAIFGTSLHELYVMSQDPQYDLRDLAHIHESIDNIRAFIARARAREERRITNMRELEDEIVLSFVDERRVINQIEERKPRVGTRDVQLRQLREEQRRLVELRSMLQVEGTV